MPHTPTYGATYIVSATDHSLDAIRARLMPLAQSAGFDSISLSCYCARSGTSCNVYAHAKDLVECLPLVQHTIGTPLLTMSETEDKATAALYAIIGRDNTGSL